MAYAYYSPSRSRQELVDSRSFVVGFIPRSPEIIHRQIPPLHLGVVFQQCHPSVLTQIDRQRSNALHLFMEEEGQMPSSEENQKRKEVIDKLKQIVNSWIQEVVKRSVLPENVIGNASATILSFGSYGLGVHGTKSDIDALCVGPWFANITEDFFTALRKILQNTPKVSNIYCIKSAKVPLMRFKFEGFLIDLPYARLHVLPIPEYVDFLNPDFLTNIDDISWRSLSGVRVNQCILQLVPDFKSYQSLLRCIRYWAKQRGIYGNLFGFLGGIHLAILAAFVCQRSRNVGLSMLIWSFFDTFARWPWPLPIALQDRHAQILEDFNDKRSWMPIRMPSTREYCHSNITRSTFNRIEGELLRGHRLIRRLLRSDFDWRYVFKPFLYQYEYQRFLKIYISASTNDDLAVWVGWVKSRFRLLILKMEDIQGLCDPNPTEYITNGEVQTESSVAFYWGLNPGYHTLINLAQLRDYFWKNITNCYQGKIGNVRLSVVQASHLPTHQEYRY